MSLVWDGTAERDVELREWCGTATMNSVVDNPRWYGPAETHGAGAMLYVNDEQRFVPVPVGATVERDGEDLVVVPAPEHDQP